MSTVPRMVRQINARPPRTPPTIAPIFVDSCFKVMGIEPDVAATDVSAGVVDVSRDVGVGCETEVVKDILGTDVGLDDVGVADAAFGDGKSLSVPALAPQAMYSYDWSRPAIDSTVEQNCVESLGFLSFIMIHVYGMTDHEKVVMSVRRVRRPQPSVQE